LLCWSVEEAEHLLGKMQQLYDIRDYAGVVNLQREIWKCLRLFASSQTCVEIASLLATAMTASGAHTVAIADFRWAHRHHNDGDMHTSANALRRLSAKLLMARICAGLGRAYTAVGNCADAESYIATCITLRNDLDNTPATMMPYWLMQAQNWHALHKHDKAIAIMTHGRTVAATVDFADCLAEKSGICPIRLLRRCYTAIGKYNEALTCLASASLSSSKRKDAVSMVTCRLEYAATKWAHVRCENRSLERTAHALYFSKDFLSRSCVKCRFLIVKYRFWVSKVALRYQVGFDMSFWSVNARAPVSHKDRLRPISLACGCANSRVPVSNVAF